MRIELTDSIKKIIIDNYPEYKITFINRVADVSNYFSVGDIVIMESGDRIMRMDLPVYEISTCMNVSVSVGDPVISGFINLLRTIDRNNKIKDILKNEI